MISIDELRASDSWREVFNREPEPAAGENVSVAPVRFDDIAEIVAHGERSPEGFASWSGALIARLNDGRWIAAAGWCDTTGWDCQSGAEIKVASTREAAMQFGLSDEDRRVLEAGDDRE